MPAWCGVDSQETARADAFFVTPSSPLGYQTDNAPIHDTMTDLLSWSSIVLSANALNGAARVYAPRYRSASSAVQATAPFYNWRRFNSTDERVHAALHLAYDDVERAFFQFLDERSPDSSRPIILASHSQGTMHLKRLLSRLPDSRHASALDRIAVAYLLGNSVEADEVPLPPCDSPTQTRCFVSWNAVLTNGTAGWYWRQKALRSNGSLPVCTNPTNVAR